MTYSNDPSALSYAKMGLYAAPSIGHSAQPEFYTAPTTYATQSRGCAAKPVSYAASSQTYSSIEEWIQHVYQTTEKPVQYIKGETQYIVYVEPTQVYSAQSYSSAPQASYSARS
eukprot:gnl/MRDRNA2_/MRDRNA2_108953_c0_seq1.p1 gnl/MRDRNA2_/MRDRNA2_108953_c0~~gnl/MRDRNA2_/MRDRNA2_108953_c0_seq1.p1  ORF type:complete len:114 (+),score=9.01 gnl/MRDRNA2_/MRDRNA2_108953_c0_seq1:79-420(+)